MVVVYGSRPIKERRTRDDMDAIRGALYFLLEAEHPMTCRQVFYRLVSNGVVKKTEQEYKGTVIRLLGEMRRAHAIPFDWIADNTRWMRKPTTHSGLHSMLLRSLETYRRSMWDNQGAYVEVWLEKDALAGVLYQVTGEWDVPLMVTRGYPSLSFLHSAAEAIAAYRKPTHIYYFGDYDPSGVDIPRKVEQGIREMAPDVDLTFTCVAVTQEQIATLNLPTRPTKQTDSRSKGFEGESVEVDAIMPAQLRALVEQCITQHLDRDQLRALYTTEEAERKIFRDLIRAWQP